jgi:GxxExxY protein
VSLVSSPLVESVIGHAINVHRALGPGLFELVYEQCLEYELDRHGVRFRRQVPLALKYETLRIDCAYRVDLIIEDELLVELKSVDRLAPIHYAQLLTYLKLSGVRQALLINFNVQRLTDGIKSFLAPESSS